MKSTNTIKDTTMTFNTILDEWVSTILHNESTVLERRIRLLIKPKPRFIPDKLWLRLVAKVIYIEQQDKSHAS